MKRLLTLVSLLSAAYPCAADELLGVDISVPCTLTIEFTYAENQGVGIPVGIDQGLSETSWTVVTVGSWHYAKLRFNDVSDAMRKGSTIADNLKACLERTYVVSPGVLDIEVEKADKLIAFSTCTAENQAAVDVAYSAKWAKIREAINSAASDAGDDKAVTESVSALTSKYEAWASSLSSLSSKVDGLKNDIESVRAENGTKITQLSAQLAELKALLSTDRRDEALIQIGEVQNKVVALTMQQGLFTQAINKIPELEKRVQMMMAGGGGIAFAVPPQIETYSNQISRLSVYLGSTNTEGTVGLPEVKVESESGDSSTTETDGGNKRAKYLMRYMWEMGFIPWFPAEAEASQNGVPETAPAYIGALWGSRYFYDETSGDNTSSHAVGIDMPVEWKLASRPWVLDPANMEWKNARVQFGSQMDAGNGTYTALEGDNYAACNLASRTITIVSAAGSAAGTCYFYVGTVTNGKQTGGSYYTPIIFMWE